MNAKELIEDKRPLPNWASVHGVYADLTDWPDRVSYFCKCPKCGAGHEGYETMREAHAKRLCPSCDIKSVNDLKDYIATVDDPDQRGKPGKSTTKMFHESDDPDDFDVEVYLDRTISNNWMMLAMLGMRAETNSDVEPVDELPEDPEAETNFNVTVDGIEWTIYKDDGCATKVAIDRVRDDVENTPELFREGFLDAFIDKERLKRDLLMDMDFAREFTEQYQDEDEQVDELIEQDLLEEDDFFTPKGTRRKISPKRDRLLDKAIDAWAERRSEEFDPEEWLRDVYGKEEATKEAIRIGGIDAQAAAEAAVSADGWAHYISQYDGDYISLNGGAVAFRT